MEHLTETPTASNRFRRRLFAVALAFALSLAAVFGAGCSSSTQAAQVSLIDVPAYAGEPYVEVDGNAPSFSDDEITTKAYEEYYDLDAHGRATGAEACIGTELMPTAERESIYEVKPTGWHTSNYDFIENGGSLYNRSHLIAFQLTGENANAENLVTGTRYMNATTMLPFEEKVGDYVRRTRNHVMYRVTPVYDGDNLVASGLHMEALSVEDGGRGISFNVYVYNVQPGVEIDYATGDNWADGTIEAAASDGESAGSGNGWGGSRDDGSGVSSFDASQYAYVLNTGGMKIHRSDCEHVAEISERNKQGYNGTLEEAEAMGYAPCGSCRP